MTPERWEQVQEWFNRLVNLPLEESRRQLEKLGADDPELRREVEARLGAEEESGDFLKRAVSEASDRTSAVTEQRRDRVGQTISHYRIDERLGGGGMGVVYKAQDLRLNRSVALKFLPPATDDDDERLKRLIVEARAASALDHPNICTIHQIDQTTDGHWFIVMAYYHGETLKARIERGPLPIDETLDFAAQIAQGLVKAHKEGIVHRDLKPANLMVTTEGVVKIVDFGLAQLVAQTKLTAPGTRLGTPAYMSPEQAQGQPLDHRTDIWSLGVVLYEMLAGRSPFKGEYELAVIYSIVNEEPTPLRQLRPDVRPEVLRIVDKALAKTPANRYQQVEEVLPELEQLKSPQSRTVSPAAQTSFSSMPPVEAASPGRKRLIFAGLAAAAAVIIAVLLFRTMSIGPGDSEETATPPFASTPEPVSPGPPAESPAEIAEPVESAQPTPSEAPSAAAANQELTEWTRIRNSRDVAVFEAFQRMFPNGALQEEAQARIQALRAERAAATKAASPAAPVGAWPAASQRWALIIGIEDYADDGISAFRGAARDAAALEEALVRYAGFPQDQVVVLSSSDSAPLRSPTRANIESYLENVSRLVPREGLLLFCFVGHAVTLNGQPALLPVDARLAGGAIPIGGTVRLESVRGAVRRRGIRQAVMLFDAFRQNPRASQNAANVMNEVYARRLSFDTSMREVDAFAALYAAAPTERGYEHPSNGGGYFVSVLVEGLKGAAADDRGFITLGSLDRYVRSVVPKRVMGELGARAVQRPFSEIAGYVSDDVVIATVARRELTETEPAQRQRTPPADSPAQELVEWTRIRESRDIAVFEAFLRSYPNGSLRREAQTRIEELKWETARGASDPAVLEQYLSENPQSRFASQARARLQELRPAPPPEPAPVAKAEPPRTPPESDAIREVLRRYSEAYGARDVVQVHALWPTLTPEQVRRLADSFRVAVSVQQNLSPLGEPSIQGDRATIRCRRSTRYEDERGPQRPVEDEVTVVLAKQQGSWVIQAVN